MLKMPHHPLSRRQGRPHRQGRQFRRSRRCRRSGRAGALLRRRGRRRADASSTSPRRRTIARRFTTSSRRTAEQCFMPLTVGGGVRTVEDIRTAAAGRRRQGLDQHRGGRRGPNSCARRPQKFGSQCIVVAIDAKASGAGALGSLHPWRPARHRHRRGRMGEAHGGARRRRDPADLDGPRRHQARGSTFP